MLWQTIPVHWMTNPTPTLLITRPQPAADRFVGNLPRRILSRVNLCISPLIRIERIAMSIDFGDARGVIFSSANGVAAAAGLTDRRDLPAYCVGEATTRLARAEGWAAQRAGDTAQALIASLLGAGERGPLLHLSGVHTRGEIAETLTAGGCTTRRVAVYDQKLVPLSDEAQAVLARRGPVVVPVFSPRTARHFVGQCPNTGNIHLIAMSAAVAESLSALANKPLTIAERPDADSMVEQIERAIDRFCRVESAGGAQ